MSWAVFMAVLGHVGLSRFDMTGSDQEEMIKSFGMAFSVRDCAALMGLQYRLLLRTTSWFYFIYSCIQNSSLLAVSHIILVISVLLEKTEVNYFHLLSQGIFGSVPRYENV